MYIDVLAQAGQAASIVPASWWIPLLVGFCVGLFAGAKFL